MKKFFILFLIFFVFFKVNFFSLDENVYSENSTSETNSTSKAKSGFAVIPEAKRPQAMTAELQEKANAIIDDEKSSGYEDTLRYGVAGEIVDLLSTFIKNNDFRFAQNVYDVFFETKAVAVREKIIEYFLHFKDPCIEDFAVEVLNDPYDEKDSTVSLVFKYVSEVKTKAAVPAILKLLEEDKDMYFAPAVTALGEIGGDTEAVYLADYFFENDLSTNEKQALMRTLGKLRATKTWSALSEIAQNEDENIFVRMYAAEAIGAMENTSSIPILEKLYESSDPNLRQYVVKGLAFFPNDTTAQKVLLEAIRDEYWKVRMEAIDVAKKNKMQNAVSFLLYRAKNEKEKTVKYAAFAALATFRTNEARDFFTKLLNEKKASDDDKARAVKVLLENEMGESEVIALSNEVMKDELHKNLRYAIAKELLKNPKPSYEEICKLFLQSKDVATKNLGLDLWQKGNFTSLDSEVQTLANEKRESSAKKRAQKLLENKNGKTTQE